MNDTAILDILDDFFPASPLIRASTKKVRGIACATQVLRSEILAAFDDADKPVTVRQMYYLLTVRGAVEKTEAGYRQVQHQLVLMRRAGLIPYIWIADNTRWVRRPTTFNDVPSAVLETARAYRRMVWKDLPVTVEVWCEKDALAGVIVDVTSVYDVPLLVARGYSSESFAYEAAQTIKENGKPGIVYYVGDFDPSGWNMSANLEKKLRQFGADISFERLAIKPEQIEAWNLPSRPTKRTDTRCREFFDTFGADTPSVELDALHPNTLRQIIREAIEIHLPAGHLADLEMVEAEERELWQELLNVAHGATA